MHPILADLMVRDRLLELKGARSRRDGAPCLEANWLRVKAQPLQAEPVRHADDELAGVAQRLIARFLGRKALGW